MSLTLNMVGGGGGGLKATDALLRVQAPAGSTVTIAKGATTKTDLGHENADDHTVYDYYFIIHQSQFDSINPWTVTATLTGEDPVTETVIIDSADEYDVVLDYTAWLYKEGNEYALRTGGWTADGYTSSATVHAATKNPAELSYDTTNGSDVWILGTENIIDASKYSTLKVSIPSSNSTLNIIICKTKASFMTNGVYLSVVRASSSTRLASMSLTGLSQTSFYVAMYVYQSSGAHIKVDKVWLE